MKKIRYLVVVIFEDSGDVSYAACECPAGRGEKGKGKCNHVGSVLFCVEDFTQKGFHKETEVVTCTSKLNGWIVPRNLNVEPTPVKHLKIKKEVHGKKGDAASITEYDPRAPNQREVDMHALSRLYADLEDACPRSGFFLFHETANLKITDDDIAYCEEVVVETSVHMVEQEKSASEVESLLTKASQFLSLKTDFISNASRQVTGNIKNDVRLYMENEQAFIRENDEILVAIEKCTKEQADSKLWVELHKYTITASNFGRIVKCKSPQSALNSLLSTVPSYLPSICYGKKNEKEAITTYIDFMENKGTAVQYEKSGIIVCKEFPGLGASPDGIIFDITTQTKGCLEVKCPLSKAGLTVEEAVQDSQFCLHKVEDGIITLSKKHGYYYQVQGQMFAAGLNWTDFVVWFGPSVPLFVERIYFDDDLWTTDILPKLKSFYECVFVPELLKSKV